MIKKCRINDIPKEYYGETYCVFEFEMEGAYPDKLWLIKNGEGPIIIEGLSGSEYCYSERFDKRMKEFLESIVVDTTYVNYNIQLDLDYAKKRWGVDIKTWRAL